MDLLFPQWQGAGDLPSLAAGARRLAELAPDRLWQEVPVDTSGPLALQDGILGRGPLLRQLEAARSLLSASSPGRLFTLGGDCAVELAPVSHLNARYGPDLSLVWLDAHADLNTPATSPSGTLHGMPLRHLLGEGDPEMLGRLASTLAPERVVLAGVRELDPPEAAFAEARGLARVSADDLNARPTALGDRLLERGARKLYLHLDLDVLDPADFGALGWPTAGGVTLAALLAVLGDLHGRFEVVGGGLTEYLPGAGEHERDALRVLRAWLGEAGPG